MKDRHGPCPMCGGTDPFRFDNKGGNGTYICNRCGAGNGVDLLMKFKGLDFKAAADEVRGKLGIAGMDVIKPEITDEKRMALIKQLAASCVQIAAGDTVDRYLTARGLSEKVYPSDLKFAPDCYYSHGVTHPAMVAAVRDPSGKVVTLHRTYLGDGCKADVDGVRKIMPGPVPEGSCVRLGDVQETIGIAEGIETAMAASNFFELPVWSAINSTMMEKWQPPEGVKRVWIFGDNDPKFGGQKAAFTLAHKLAVRGIDARVKIPETEGHDWADVYARGATT